MYQVMHTCRALLCMPPLPDAQVFQHAEETYRVIGDDAGS